MNTCCLCNDAIKDDSRHYEIKVNGVRQVVKMCENCVLISFNLHNIEDLQYHKSFFEKTMTKSDKSLMNKYQMIFSVKFDRTFYVSPNNIKIYDNGMCFSITEDTDFIDNFGISM